jgi:hypothetical protein
MTLHESRAEFVRRIWDRLVQKAVPSYELSLWVPDKLIKGFGERIDRRDLEKIDLGSPDICTLCFAKLHRTLNRIWPQLSPEFAVSIERSLNELNLWEGFDTRKVRVSGSQRDAVKVRFDIADIAYAAGKETFDRELEALGVDLKKTRIGERIKEKEPAVIAAIQQRVAERAQIDLAVLTIQRLSRGREILEKIANRLETERYHYREFARDILINSTLWQSPDGETYIGKEEIPSAYMNETQRMVDKRLKGFYDFLDQFAESLDKEIPPQKVIDRVSAMMREYVMPEQNVTTNINVSNSQIGVLNTGSIQDVHSIDASITTLKSHGDLDVGDAFKRITEGIMKDDAVSQADKEELLSNVRYLTEMAAKKQDERSPSVIRSVLRSVSDGINAAGPAVKALISLIPVISKFFGF